MSYRFQSFQSENEFGEESARTAINQQTDWTICLDDGNVKFEIERSVSVIAVIIRMLRLAQDIG